MLNTASDISVHLEGNILETYQRRAAAALSCSSASASLSAEKQEVRVRNHRLRLRYQRRPRLNTSHGLLDLHTFLLN